MKKSKKIILSLLTIGSLAFTSSCNNYLDINDDPNNIPTEKATPNLVFPGAVSESYRIQGRRMALFSGLMMNSFAGNSYSYGTPFLDDYTPNATTSFYADIWDDTFRNIANFQLILDYSDPKGDYTQYKAMAKIMKAYYFQILVDFYNDVPYTEFAKLQANLRPKYDKSEDVYKASITDLNDAIALINGKEGTIPGGDDIVFKGDMNKWKQFANSIKLRYLMRMSKVTGEMGAFRDQQLATLSNAQYITEDVRENPGYSASSNDQQNPFANYFVITAAASRPQNYTLVVPSEHMAIALNGNVGNGTTDANDNGVPGAPDTRAVYQKFTGIVDGRRGRIFTINAKTKNVEGVRQGATPGQPGAESGRTSIVSRLGYGLSMGKLTPSTTAQLVSNASANPGTLMTLSELKFLLAEASLAFPARFTNGQAAFEDGITASYNYLGASGAPAYIAKVNAVPGLGWTGTNEQKLEAVMTQKWIALTGINEEQSYFDYSKTGYPVTPSATVSTTRKPYRLLYPTSEYASNSSNVPNVTAADIFVKNQFTPFWNRN